MIFYDPLELPDNVAILLMPGFEEGTAVFCADKLRNAGLPVSVIGTSNQPIKGTHGIMIQPDTSIGDIKPDQFYRIVVVSGGRQHISASMIDPRIYQLLRQTVEANGYIAPIARAKEFLEDVGFANSNAPYIISDNDKELQEFVNELIQLATIESMQPELLQ